MSPFILKVCRILSVTFAVYCIEKMQQGIVLLFFFRLNVAALKNETLDTTFVLDECSRLPGRAFL